MFAPAERGFIGERKYQGLSRKWRKGQKGNPRHTADALGAEGGVWGREEGGGEGERGGVKRVVQEVMQKGHWEDVDLVLNAWPGRKDRSHFPLLIKVSVIVIQCYSNAIGVTVILPVRTARTSPSK